MRLLGVKMLSPADAAFLQLVGRPAQAVHDRQHGLQHQYQQQDSQVSALCQRLLDCETANIRQMQSFL